MSATASASAWVTSMRSVREPVADLLLLEGERLGAGRGVEAVLEHGPRRLGDDAHPLAGVHAQVSTRGGSASRIAGSSSK